MMMSISTIHIINRKLFQNAHSCFWKITSFMCLIFALLIIFIALIPQTFCLLTEFCLLHERGIGMLDAIETLNCRKQHFLIER